jgi:hypothetical protein
MRRAALIPALIALGAALAAGGWAWPAPARQLMPNWGDLVLPRPLDSTAPPEGLALPERWPPLAADRDPGGRQGCAPAWPCRLRLFGVIDKNGGVGLEGTALTW